METLRMMWSTIAGLDVRWKYILFGLLLMTLGPLSEQGFIAFSTISIVVLILVYAIVALGLNLLMGYSGLISLATAGFMGLGAYLMVYLSNTLAIGFFAALGLTLLISGLIGVVIGLFSLRVEGIYLAIATLFFGEILLQIFRQVTWFSSGFSGLRFRYPLIQVFAYQFNLTRLQTFNVVIVALILTMILLHHVAHSATGRALMAISRSESAAQAMGIGLMKYRILAFSLATIIAAFGGVMYVSFFRYVEPSGWNLNLSLFLIAMVVVGGFKSFFGTVMGAFIIYGIPNLFLKDTLSGFPGFSFIFSGVLIILVILFYPYGAVHIGSDLKKIFRRVVGGPS